MDVRCGIGINAVLCCLSGVILLIFKALKKELRIKEII